jgi:hypothetical protein
MSFFYLDFEDDEHDEVGASNAAIISFTEACLGATELEAELKHLVECVWDWKVTPLAPGDFFVVFPSQDTMRMSARSGRLFLPLSETMAKIRLAEADPTPVEKLLAVWVLLSSLPRRMRRADRLRVGMRMLGRPLAVDEDSLTARGPMRMQLECRNPDKLNGVVQLFHKSLGYNLGVRVLQGPPPANDVPPPPPPPRRGHDDDQDDDDDGDASSLSEGE